MQAIEKENASIGALIADLPTCEFIVNADILTESVKETLDGRTDLAGKQLGGGLHFQRRNADRRRRSHGCRRGKCGLKSDLLIHA